MSNGRLILRLFPNASRATLEANGAGLLDPESQRDGGKALEDYLSTKAGGLGRTVVRFTRYCVRPLDTDNFCGGVKGMCDALRYAGLIRGDEPWRIKLEFEQEKVGTYVEQRTEIELIYP